MKNKVLVVDDDESNRYMLARRLEVYVGESRPELVKGKEAALFVSKYGGRLRVSRLRARGRQHGRGVRLDVSPHGLRHAYATRPQGDDRPLAPARTEVK